MKHLTINSVFLIIRGCLTQPPCQIKPIQVKLVHTKTKLMFQWVGRLDIVKIAILPKLTYKFNVILIKISAAFFAEIDNLILKFIGRCKKSRAGKTT